MAKKRETDVFIENLGDLAVHYSQNNFPQGYAVIVERDSRSAQPSLHIRLKKSEKPQVRLLHYQKGSK